MASMQPRGFTGKLASFSSRHPWRIVGIWLAIFLVAGAISAVFPAEMTTDATFTNEPESERGDELIDERMNGSARPDEMLIVQSDRFTVDQPEFRAVVDELTAEIMAEDSAEVQAVSSYYETGDETLLSDNRQAMILPVFLIDPDEIPTTYIETVEAADGMNGFTVVTGGENSIAHTFNHTAESDLLTGETVGISVALIVLVIVFATLVAAGVPLVLAVMAISIATGITAIIGNVVELSTFVTNMIVMIGLAVGIDYTLFIVGRYREERNRGKESGEAIVRAADTASKAVLFSGLTVVIALLGMLIVPSNIFKSLGGGSIIVVIVSVAATLTLLPAGLKLLGEKIDRGRGRTLMGFMGVFLLLFAVMFQLALDVSPIFPIVYTVLGIGSLVLAVLNIDPFHGRDTSNEGGFWGRIASFVMHHPVVLLSVTTVGLLAIGSIYFTISLGQSGISTMPHDAGPYRAFTLIERDFSGISLEEPHIVVVNDENVNSPEIQAAIEQLQAEIADDADFGPAAVRVNEAGDLATVAIPATSDTQSSESLDAAQRLRDDYIPTAFAGVDAEVVVTGPSAITVDFNDVVNRYTPIVFAFVLGASLILLLVAFRSIVVPIKSVIMNLLSVGASYGLLVAVFQHGWGNELFGFKQVERIDAWIPLMMFTILFGLSMDYHVFLLSRIKEHYDKSGNNTESVAYGVRSTASIITGAALIMVAVFGGFAMADLSMFQQMGFGLATAVILDATIVRVIMVPAAMKLLNNWNWYFPSVLDWVPRINVEGAEEEESYPVPEGATAD